MSTADVIREADRLNVLIDEELRLYREQGAVAADAEQAYRHGKDDAWQRCPRDPEGVRQNGEWPAKRREAWVDAQVADLRHARDIAVHTSEGARDALRIHERQLSVLQTLTNAERAEDERAAKARAGRPLGVQICGVCGGKGIGGGRDCGRCRGSGLVERSAS